MLNCKTHNSIAPTESSTPEVHKNSECKFEANCCETFLEMPTVFKNDSAPTHSSKFTQECEITKKIPGTTWPAQTSDMHITENLWFTIKLKLFHGRYRCVWSGIMGQ